MDEDSGYFKHSRRIWTYLWFVFGVVWAAVLLSEVEDKLLVFLAFFGLVTILVMCIALFLDVMKVK